MKTRLFALVLSLALTVALAGCTSDNADKNNTDSGNEVTQSDSARARGSMAGTDRRSSVTSSGRGRYFADRKGDVRDDRTDWVGDDMRRAADDMMDRARDMGDKMGNAVEDMTH